MVLSHQNGLPTKNYCETNLIETQRATSSVLKMFHNTTF